jgi:hypothetical protein
MDFCATYLFLIATVNKYIAFKIKIHVVEERKQPSWDV